MRSRSLSSLLLSAAILFTTITPIARAAGQNRIAGAVSNNSRVALPGTISGRAKRSVDLGAAPADRKLESMSLRFSMTAAQQADLNQLLAAQLNPSSPSYHQWLTPAQFGARFGLSSGDLATVSSWLTSQGLTITSVAHSSTFITFNGTVGQVQQAFGTSIHNVSFNGEQHITNLTDPMLPSGIAGVVSTVTGLDDFKLKPHSRARAVPIDSTQPLYTQTTAGVTSHFLSPADWYTIYDVTPLTAAGITGKGITVAVMGQTDIIPQQIAQFRTAAGLPANVPTQMLIPTSTDPGLSAPDIDEAQIDVEWSGTAAQGATILYVFSTDVFDSLTYAIDNKVAPIVTISYGLCESAWGTATLASDNLLLAQANSQGQTVMAAAGDDGATDCDTVGLASEGLSVDFPASSPYATSAGGTMFSGDVNTPATYWSSTNGTNGGSALSYIPEQPWNETNASGGLTTGGAGGGGASAFFSKPSWQTGLNVPNDGSRDAPDISLNAAAMHDGYLVCTEEDGTGSEPCTNGFLTSTGTTNIFGGTSFVAPSFAGILALVEQKLGGAPGAGIGNVGPVLYGFLNGPTYTSVFHDITTGNNSVPCSQGTLNCPNGGSIGFNAGTGYDQATGIGSFDIGQLVNGWSSVTPVGGGSAIGAGITTTSLTTSSAICAVSSGTLALTIGVTGSIAGTTPTGSVQIFVDNVAVSGAVITLPATTYTLNTSTLSSGGHVISAVYSGDGNYAGSKGTLLGPATNTSFYPNGPYASVDIVSGKDFGLTPCTGTATAVTVLPGATATGITFTITPANGFTGTVNLTATNNDGMTATTTFTPASVNVTTGAVTTSLVVQAFQTTAQLSRPGLVPHSQRPLGKAPWYAAGSGATLACVLLLMLPRRRRWGALLAVLISLGAITAVGCGASNTSTTGGGGGGGGGTTTADATAGTYTFTITAVSGSLVHSTQVTVTVP
ncbi:MAG: protease pro-enzyme activation domain-containing protein [Edaphobacter sp.]